MKQKLLHTPEGVRDIYGTEYKKKLVVEDVLHRKLSSYGYMDIQTPTFEYFDVFSKEIGTTASKDLYKFFDKEGETLVLRPDFTPSIARCAAKYFMEDAAPLRFSYLGNTFSNTSDLQGKLKETTEVGAELIGDTSVYADAEMISLVIESLLDCGLTNFQVSVGQVEYFRGICQGAGLDDETERELRELISVKNLFAAEDLLQSRKVSLEHAKALLKTADMFGGIDFLEEAAKNANNETSRQAISRLEALYDVLKLYGYEQYVSFDLGMLSKYNYYTGVIFKVYTYGVGDAIVKGGRYDQLLEKFGKKSPSIGFVLVIDELMKALMRQNIRISYPRKNTIILYEEDKLNEAISLAKDFRNKYKNTEMLKRQSEKSLNDYIAYGKEYHASNLIHLQSDGQIVMVNLITNERKTFHV